MADNASLQNQRPALGMFYDMAARRQWHERSCAGVLGFDVRARVNLCSLDFFVFGYSC